MLDRAWTTTKLIYLYLQYWVVGLDEEGFQVTKGRYLCDLGLYPAAARAYQRALRDTQSPYVHASLGYCYLNMALSDKAITHLQNSYSRRPAPDVGVALLRALQENGNIDEARRLHPLLLASAATLSPELQQELSNITRDLATAELARSSERRAIESEVDAQGVGADKPQP